jgi:hypothetical protein
MFSSPWAPHLMPWLCRDAGQQSSVIFFFARTEFEYKLRFRIYNLMGLNVYITFQVILFSSSVSWRLTCRWLVHVDGVRRCLWTVATNGPIVLTVMKNSISVFRVVTPRGPVCGYQYLRGTYSLLSSEDGGFMLLRNVALRTNPQCYNPEAQHRNFIFNLSNWLILPTELSPCCSSHCL